MAKNRNLASEIAKIAYENAKNVLTYAKTIKYQAKIVLHCA